MSTTPLNRWEKFMAKIAGQDVDIQPLNRKEQFYDEIAQKTGAALTPTITEPSDGDVIKYDATEGKWVNGEGGGSGGGGVLVVNAIYDESTNTSTCDKTASEMMAALATGGLIIREDGDTAGAYTYMSILQAIVSDSGYTFLTYDALDSRFIAASASDYPTASNQV